MSKNVCFPVIGMGNIRVLVLVVLVAELEICLKCNDELDWGMCILQLYMCQIEQLLLELASPPYNIYLPMHHSSIFHIISHSYIFINCPSL